MFSSKRTYLDYAAAHPVRSGALRAFTKALSSYGNPSAAHTEGREAKALLDDARTRIARLTGSKKEHVVFTGNATEANALAIEGVVRARVRAGAQLSDLHILYMSGAHASVVKTVEALEKQGVQTDVMPLTDRALTEATVTRLLRPETCLVSVEIIMSETGLRVDSRAVKLALERAGSSALLHVDASQAPLVESLERTRLGADLITLDAQKVGGVRGIGALIHAPGVSLVPLIHGGGQERGLRSGTEAPALAQAFAHALEEAADERESFVVRARAARERMLGRIKTTYPSVLINEGKEQAPHIVNLSFSSIDTDYLVALLDEAGFAVATRSSCETDAEHGSRAVLELTGDTVRAASTLRISWGHATTERTLLRFSDALIRALSFLDRTSS